MINGDTVRSVELIKEHVDEFPLDALMVFVAQFRLSFSGRRSWKQEIAALTEAFRRHMTPTSGRSSDCGPFGPKKSVTSMWHGPSPNVARLQPGERAAAHVLAHTYFERGEHEAGSRFLDLWLTTHHPQRLFAGHLWWHFALHQLGLGDGEGACQTLRTGIAGAGRSPFRVPDLASLLWRMDLYGLGSTPMIGRRLRTSPPTRSPNRASPSWTHTPCLPTPAHTRLTGSMGSSAS